MINKHTPGPWEVVTFDDGPERAMGYIITNATYKGEIDANARLVAAAPELLEALERLAPKDGPKMTISEFGGFECCFCGGDFSNHIGDFKHHGDCDYLSARAAIAKAKGE
jgi:hypothetical protein